MTRLASNPSAAGRLRGFASVYSECEPIEPKVSGELPPWLSGNLLLNGPALWDFPAARYEHWFDGLALLHRFQIGAGRVRYHNRFLRSQDWQLAQANGRPMLGGFDTPVAGGLLSRLRHLGHPQRTDNGCVVISPCGGQWLAGTESDRLLRFDPDSLETLGELGWADAEQLPLMAAHPCIDAGGRWWNVAVKLGPSCQYVLFHADAAGRREIMARIPVKRAGYLHAFALSAGHAVIWECAWRAQPLRFLFSGESYAQHFDWLPEGGSRIHTVSLADGAVRSWDAPALMAFHATQAYEVGGDVVLDLCLDDIAVVDELKLEALRAGRPTQAPRARHTRLVLSPAASAVREEALPGRFELPQVHPALAGARAARYVWAASASDGAAFFNLTVKLDHQTGALTKAGLDDAIALEPLFVPRPGAAAEDDGLLLVHTLTDTAAGSCVRVLDAADLRERAAIELPHVMPFGFHGAWRSA